MLKVEKQRGVVAVSGRCDEKHSFIVTAFLCALGIHLSALLFFHIAPLNLLGSGSMISPPAMVTTEWKEEIISSLDEPPKQGLLSPPPKRPIFEKKLPTPLANRMLNLPWESWFHQEFTAYLDQTFIKELATVATGIELSVFGDLAERPLEWKNPPTTIPNNLSSYPAIARFEVEVSETNGEVFKKRFLEGDLQLAKTAEVWIDEVKFTPKANRFSVKGEMKWTVGAP